MRKLVPVLAFVACAAGGLLAAAALAGSNPVALLTTTGTGTSPTPTSPTTTDPPPPPVIADGVTVAGVAVGGMLVGDAETAVRDAFAQPLPLRIAGRTLTPTPAALGATPYVLPAIARARTAAPGTKVTLFVRIRGERVRAYVVRLGKRFDRKPRDATMRLRNLRPAITPERVGRVLDRAGATRAIVARLRANSRAPLGLRIRTLRPAVTRSSFGSVIVIRRSSKRLYLYEGARLRRVFGVATGASSYPTPLGRFNVVVKARHPWWYPPDSDWAEGLEPVPPGPGNPLGTRWMGLSAPGVGIHGTPDSASIGYSASHGCIRMLIPQAEWLFDRIDVGTPVYIVAA